MNVLMVSSVSTYIVEVNVCGVAAVPACVATYDSLVQLFGDH